MSEWTKEKAAARYNFEEALGAATQAAIEGGLENHEIWSIIERFYGDQFRLTEKEYDEQEAQIERDMDSVLTHRSK